MGAFLLRIQHNSGRLEGGRFLETSPAKSTRMCIFNTADF